MRRGPPPLHEGRLDPLSGSARRLDRLPGRQRRGDRVIRDTRPVIILAQSEDLDARAEGALVLCASSRSPARVARRAAGRVRVTRPAMLDRWATQRSILSEEEAAQGLRASLETRWTALASELRPGALAYEGWDGTVRPVAAGSWLVASDEGEGPLDWIAPHLERAGWMVIRLAAVRETPKFNSIRRTA